MLLRDALGETLRDARTRQNRTLRDVSTAANVSLGYLSEVERGRKEASSELLASICDALDVELFDVLTTVSTALRSDLMSATAHQGELSKVGSNLMKNTAGKNSMDSGLRIVVPYGKARGGKQVAVA